MYNYLKQLEQHVDADALKEDLTKLGINLVTASVVGVFITHAADISLVFLAPSASIIVAGIAFCYSAIRK